MKDSLILAIYILAMIATALFIAISPFTVTSAKVVTVPNVLEIVEEQQFDCNRYDNCYASLRKIHDNNNDAICYVYTSKFGDQAVAMDCI